ncbi:MAG: SDR family NAD(P)-dependent oxidoreductase [Acidobacteriia bacterium]|nr:SDR family NAD(P)-dependent oxidoreductase [Terriglobia bacterium]
MKPSEGRRILITGASSGIGEALAKEFASRGAHVGLLARREPQLRRLRDSLRQAHPRQKFCCVAVDVRDSAALETAVGSVIQELGGMDVAIANGGIGEHRSAFSSHHWEIGRNILEVNLLGAIHTLEIAKSYWVKNQRSGQLVGISSVAGARGLPQIAAYSTSKEALAAYLEAIRGELATGGIGVLSIHPGYIRTPMTARNRFYMPWLMDAEKAARKIANAIEAEKKRYVFPVPMRFIYAFLRHVPGFLYDYETYRLAVRSRNKKKPTP